LAVSVGLEIGSRSIKALVLSGNEKSAKVKDYVVEKLDSGKGVEEDIVTLLEGLFRTHKLPRSNVLVSMRALDCVMRDVAVPFIKDAQIRSTIKFQAENYFHSLSIDDYLIEYHKYAEDESKSRLFVAGIKKSQVERRLALLEEIQVDPVAIDLDVAAVYNSYRHAGLFQDRRLVVIVDMESDRLRLVVVENGELRTARSIRKRLEERGKKVKDESGESARLPVVILDDEDEEDSFSLEDSGISSIERDSYLHSVFREIDRTVALAQSDEEVDFIILTGASCGLPGIEEMFEEHFEVEARRVVDFGSSVGGVKGNEPLALGGSVALGLALKGLGVDYGGMDFRQEEYVYQGRFEQLKQGLACALCLAFVLCFLVAFGLKQELRVKKERFAGVKLMQEHVFTVLFPSVDDPSRTHRAPIVPGNWLFSTRKEYDRLADFYGGAVAKKAINESAIDILREFSSFKARCPTRIEVMRARVSQDQTRIRCVSLLQNAPIDLNRVLQSSTMFESHPERIQSKKAGRDGKPDRWEFDMVLELKSKKKGKRR